ncbi:hypothetical protein HZS_2325, partial [Henneguya salminicola]
QLSFLNSTLELDQNSEQSLENDDIFYKPTKLNSCEKLNNNIDIYNSFEHIQPMSLEFNEFPVDGSYELNTNNNYQENFLKAESDGNIL